MQRCDDEIRAMVERVIKKIDDRILIERHEIVLWTLNFEAGWIRGVSGQSLEGTLAAGYMAYREWQDEEARKVN